MKTQILDEPFHDSFADFLKKGETILWEDSAINPKYAIIPINHKSFTFSRNKKFFLFITILLFSFFFFFSEKYSGYGFFLLLLYIIASTFLRETDHSSDVAKFAISNKRILLKSNYSKQRMIYEISFTQLNNCLVDERNSDRGTIFLILKNPEEVQFETFYIRDNGELEKRHQPTLENIENPQTVAKLIRERIKNVTASL